jgi:NTP pyrophosphatase (non-canonical NTP hydrolase)
MSELQFKQLVEQTREMNARFEKIERRPWGIEGSMIELSKQVGELSKRVMMAEQYYLKSRESIPEYQATQDKIADELFDIWYCLIKIADYYKVELEKTIDKTTKEEIEKFKRGEITA